METNALENIKKENNTLRHDIVKLCDRDDQKKDENILLLGKQGAGKSAIVNTVISALVGTYTPRAKVGKGVAQSKTLELIRYQNCGITFDDLRDSKYKRFIQSAYGKLPTLVDAAGLGNVNTPELREILRLILEGYIPPGTSITTLENLQKEHGVSSLNIIYDECDPRWKITKVVFVVSARDIVPPRKLIECVHAVIGGDSTRQIFVVITRYDRVKDDEDLPDEMMDEQRSNVVDVNSENEDISMEDLKILEKELAAAFSIEGARKQNMMRWTSYVDDVGYESNQNIDKIALKFLKFMVTPGPPQQDTRHLNITLWKRLKIKLNNVGDLHIGSYRLLAAAVVVVAVLAFILYKVLSMKV